MMADDGTVLPRRLELDEVLGGSESCTATSCVERRRISLIHGSERYAVPYARPRHEPICSGLDKFLRVKCCHE